MSAGRFDNFSAHNPIVFDVGSHSIRFGYSESNSPSSDIPAVIGSLLDGTESTARNDRIKEDLTYYVDTNTLCVPREGMELKNFMKKGMIEDWDAFEYLMDYAYSKCLFTDPKHHPVLFTEAPFNLKQKREKLLELMFEKYKVPGIIICKNAAAAAFSCSIPTGVIVDSGATHTSVIPIHQGYVMCNAIVSTSMGGDKMLKRCDEYLDKNKIDIIPHYLVAKKQRVKAREVPIWSMKNTLPKVTDAWHNYMRKSVLEDFQHTVLEVAENPLDNDVLLNYPTCHYEFPNGYNQIFGDERFKIPEVLFNPDNEHKTWLGLSQLVHLSVSMCKRNLRNVLYDNIILTGGNSLIKGFARRLYCDIATDLKHTRFKLTAPVNSINRRFGAWIGGSLFGITDKFNHLWLSSSDYHESGTDQINVNYRYM
ncbi:actin-like protein 6B [Aphis gossypii]|uniref:actin-like protein 6B n=1 Tax=Aphis gossypii TaxID=80765 RepID=UPI00215982DC|nr:actin-like protein 6B [Aphis gossypii]XP_050061957.1 actin-like protein 6B [Aphis gossypii]